MIDKIVARINEQYVSDDSLQTMYSYRNRMALLGEKDIVVKYLDWPNNNKENSYLEDERRGNFPYSNIPTYISKRFFRKYSCVNQILSFDHQYLLFADGKMAYDYPIRDNNQAFIVSSFPILDENNHKEVKMNYNELQELLNPKEGQIVYFDNFSRKVNIWNQDEILSYYKKQLSDELDRLEKRYRMRTTVNLNDITKIPSDCNINFVDPVFLFKIDDYGNMKFLKLNYSTRGGKIYDVVIDSYTMPKYTLSSLSSMSNVKFIDAKEPRINLNLNPNISSEEIEKAKRLVMTRSK